MQRGIMIRQTETLTPTPNLGLQVNGQVEPEAVSEAAIVKSPEINLRQNFFFRSDLFKTMNGSSHEREHKTPQNFTKQQQEPNYIKHNYIKKVFQKNTHYDCIKEITAFLLL